MASDSQLRSARLPSQKQVIELLDGEFARAGYELDDVVIDAGKRPPRITVIADGDEPLDLDSIAALSRSASELLDSVDSPPSGAPYVLEVTSPGVDRPLTAEKHYRRARGRKVELTLSDGSQLTGRLGEIDALIIETSTIATVQGGAEIGAIVRFLTEHGFALTDIVGLRRRPLDGATAQLDLLFVPSKAPPRSDRRWAASA